MAHVIPEAKSGPCSHAFPFDLETNTAHGECVRCGISFEDYQLALSEQQGQAQRPLNTPLPGTVVGSNWEELWHNRRGPQ